MIDYVKCTLPIEFCCYILYLSHRMLNMKYLCLPRRQICTSAFEIDNGDSKYLLIVKHDTKIYEMDYTHTECHTECQCTH